MEFKLSIVRAERGMNWQHAHPCYWNISLEWEDAGERRHWAISTYDLEEGMRKMTEVANQVLFEVPRA